MKHIIAIDPSLTGTGYVVFNENQTIITYGEIITKSSELIQNRLYNIYNNLKNIIQEYKPCMMIVEKMFVNMNGKSSMNIAAVRGIILLLSGEFNIEVLEPMATSIRKAVMNNGKASTLQLRHYISFMIKEQEIQHISHNIIDAIAIGMYFFVCFDIHSI